MAKQFTRRRRPPNYTTMPGGCKLTFDGYLPPKPCAAPGCGKTWPAAAFAKTPYVQNRERRMPFRDWCLQCDPPNDFPADLRGVRPTSTYTDASGKCVGWRERNRSGQFGEPLRLELMGLRKTADGVWRPQPKLDRRPAALLLSQPRAPKQYRAVTDSRRGYSKVVIRAKSLEQGGICPACRLPFTKDDPAVGGHRNPYADGWPTTPDNCVALHAACNAEQGRRSLDAYLRDLRQRQRGLFDDPGKD